MGQNIFRFTLSHISGSQVISEPDGWAKIKISLERDREYYSLVELIETPFIFYGSNGVYDGGMNFILEKKRIYGVNAQISIQIDISQDDYNYDLLFIGVIDMQSLKTIDSRKLEAVITRSSKWATFFSRRDTPVNINSTIDLDGNAISNGNSMVVNLPSQRIRQGSEDNQVYRNDMGNDWTGTPASADPNIDFNQNQYVTFELDTETLSEIDTKYHYGTTVRDDLPLPIFELDYGGVYTIELLISLTSKNLQTASPVHYEYASMSEFTTAYQHAFRLYIQINNDTPIEIPYTSYNQTVPAFTSTTGFIRTSRGLDAWDQFYYLDTFNLNAGDNIRIYFKVENATRWSEQYNGVSALILQPVILGTDNSDIQWSGLITKLPFQATGVPASFIKVTADTIYPETQSEAYFLHDTAFEIIKRTVGDNSFYSEYTGSTHTLSLSYPSDGCGWNFSLIRGLQLRNYSLSEKPFSISFKQWWDGINPIQNLGLGYDEVSGNEVIRVEEKAFFFNDSPIIYFNFVNNIEESYDKESIYNKIKIGYKKWQSENVSGIDDPQTNHDYSTLFKTVGLPITIQSDFIAASLAFEQTRRTTRKKSADYKFDDDTFILSINPTEDNSPIGYNPELDENFDSITNLLNSDSRYNLTLTPLRNLIRWFNVLSGCLQDYPTSVFKFNGGEGNYDMVSDYSGAAPGICFNKIADPISEKQDLSMSYNGLLGHLFRPEILEFKYPLSWENYKLIRDNRTRAIAISETDSDHVICHIKKLEYDLINSLGTFTVWKK